MFVFIVEFVPFQTKEKLKVFATARGAGDYLWGLVQKSDYFVTDDNSNLLDSAASIANELSRDGSVWVDDVSTVFCSCKSHEVLSFCEEY